MSPACIFLGKNSGLDASYRHIARLAELLGNRTTPVRLLSGISRVGEEVSHCADPREMCRTKKETQHKRIRPPPVVNNRGRTVINRCPMVPLPFGVFESGFFGRSECLLHPP